MLKPIHVEAIEHILSAVYSTGDHQLTSFLYGKPGSAPWERRLGAEIFVRRKEYIRALLFVRHHGAPYLREISVSDLWSKVTEFLTANFWYLRASQFQRLADVSFGDQIGPAEKMAMAGALAQSVLFEPRSELTLFPLIPICIAEAFRSKHFFLLSADDLPIAEVQEFIQASDFDPKQFPPSRSWEGHKFYPTSWLGVRSPLLLKSQKMASAILGAIALTPVPTKRYQFSMRPMFGGRCTFGDAYSISMSDTPHTPPMMSDIALTGDDHDWLLHVARLFDLDDASAGSRTRSLEYFCRAWFLDPRERFPWLCMSLDSLVGAQRRHTAESVKFVKDVIDASIDEDRLILLMRMRGAIVHGAAPDVYESQHYESYYARYEVDPVRDLELIVAECLRKAIFGSALRHHKNPDASIIRTMQESGRLPRQMDEGCIIREES
jgi:hypothetical protein